MINACRDDIYGSAQRAFASLFKPLKPLGVVFMDLCDNPEGAVDEGGPTREFCRLLMKDIQSRSQIKGPENSELLALESHGKHLVMITFIQRSNLFWKYGTMKFNKCN